MTNILMRPSVRCAEQLRDVRSASPQRTRAPARRRVVVDRPAVVGIDEIQVPELGALVEVRNARRGDLDHQLREAVVDAELRDARLERPKGCEKRRSAGGDRESRRRTASTAASYSSSGLSQLVWTFASRSAFIMYATIRSRNDVGSASSPARTATRRPASGRAGTPRSRPAPSAPVQLGLEPAVRARASVMTAAFHAPGNLRQHVQPRAHVLAAFGVVRGRRRQRGRPLPLPLRHPVVDRRRLEAEAASDRRRPRSARSGGCRRTARCPRCPSPRPGW